MTDRPGYRPYQPQLQLQPVDDNLWIVDGPEIGYRFAGLTLPCPTRMTVVRIGGELWVHSPIHYGAALGTQLEALGKVRWIIAPNSFHYSHVAAWAAACPLATCHVSPDLVDRLKGETGPLEPLADQGPPAWHGDLDQMLVVLGGFVEAIFLHRPTATLIVTDLLQNFEVGRITHPVTRAILAIGGATGPVGTTSIDIRLAARRHRRQVKLALAQMLAWNPKRIILSHGLGYDRAIPETLERAFRWATR